MTRRTKFQRRVRTGLASLWMVFCTPGHALSLNDSSDTYAYLSDEDLRKAYADALASSGETTTAKFYAFNVKGCSPAATPDPKSGDPRTSVYIHAVQDRGQPRGLEYPTYVFTTGPNARHPKLVLKIHAGKRLYLSDTIVCEPENCLLSAQQGFSDACLTDPFGTPAPGLPGLRKDFWSELAHWLGL
ncbi:hypothetical protein [Roseibium aggregatum]|uniref:Lipoprotein n=1 Tax=Roseibium aggregatum TaxID=187304 RepID=A0A939J6R8_9HYPH|nr:hypothetical protein [Roseibium aggregatum]MBN9673064.1 hypothetical protein [Roseibium aggregatum]